MIDYKQELNAAQYQAVTHTEGPVLVIAGAGSGKTRTIVYRLAHLVESGVRPEEILLLTFTRKAAQEMLQRAENILARSLLGTNGGTFHAFAYKILRMYSHALGFEKGFTLMDRPDAERAIKEAKEKLNLGKGDRSYPKKSTIADLLSKSRNKEIKIDTVIEQETFHLIDYADDLRSIAQGYEEIKKQHAFLDYDDLLFCLEQVLRENSDILKAVRSHYRYIMVDEYQDTNRVQARLVALLAHAQDDKPANVMAVGDDAQSIYAFRGADVSNILEFPKIFQGTTIISLEQNYRSTQPILDMSNAILAGAKQKFEKKLYTEKTDGSLPQMVQPLSDQSQAKQVLSMINTLRAKHPLHEIAVLFRAGYHSFPLEAILARDGIKYQKFGGIKFHEAAHIKDALCFMHLITNPSHKFAFLRILEPLKGIGPKTAERIYEAYMLGHAEAQQLDLYAQPRKEITSEKYLQTLCKKNQELRQLLADIDTLRKTASTPLATLEKVLDIYTPFLKLRYPDDYPKRQAGLEQLLKIAAQYTDIAQFTAELTLDGDQEEEKTKEDMLVLSTVHSAKGLEWDVVIIIDLVEDRFPSRKALNKPEDFEEERRLLYVACTRARHKLALFVPSAVYNRSSGMSEATLPSPFLRELPSTSYTVWQESYLGGLNQKNLAENNTLPVKNKPVAPEKLGYCQHKIFGKGKIIAKISPNKYRVNFIDFGLKTIIADYLQLL